METMTEAPICPSCSREMSYQEHIKSWKCNACNPSGENVPICKTQACKRPLTFLGEPWNCWICLHCNEHPAKVNERTAKEEKQTRKYLDVKPDENKVSGMIKEALSGISDTVRNIVQDELANWHIQRPPVTQDEIMQLPESKALEAKPETWRQKARRLGVSLHREPKGTGMKKKTEVLAEMEAVEQNQGESNGGSSDIES